MGSAVSSDHGVWNVLYSREVFPDEWDDVGIFREPIHAVVYLADHVGVCREGGHGAKVANFCFSDDGSKVAAVDFQYVGGGVGVKDLAYFLGSCFTEDECQLYENSILDFYFETLLAFLPNLELKEKVDLEQEWRTLYPMAWADFNRFLLGWMPTHQKLTSHALAKTNEALQSLKAWKKTNS